MLEVRPGPELLDYLRAAGLLTAARTPHVTELSGGVSGRVVRVDDAGGGFVVKQARPRLAVQAVWECDPARISVEADCLAVWNRLLPDNTPRLLHRDDEAHLYVMEAAPADAASWKRQLLDGLVDFRVGEVVMAGAATVHSATTADPAIAEQFAGLGFFEALRLDPYLRTVAARYPELREPLLERIGALETTKTALVHGDLSPKNVLVDHERVWILDCDPAHFGDPGFDVAFFLNHLVLKAVHRPALAPAYLALAGTALGAYAGALDGLALDAVERSACRTVGGLLMARVDGKSPVEYLTPEGQAAARVLGRALVLDDDLVSFDALLALVGEHVAPRRAVPGAAARPAATDTTITRVHGRQVLDSRGRPTVEVDVELRGGARGRAIVPAGASTGRHEAVELRDGGQRYGGAGVLQAVANVDTEIAAAVTGCDAADQTGIDERLTALDGTPDKSRLGANAILGVSLAAAWAAAAAGGEPLYRRWQPAPPYVIPVPMVQIIGGGAHADGGSDVQDYLVIPLRAASFAEALAVVADVHLAARGAFRTAGRLVAVADEGGLWPDLRSNEEGLALLTEAIAAAGYRPGEDVGIALDIAASELWDGQAYRLRLDEAGYSSEAFADLVAGWVARYPIVSIEDPMDQDDLRGWKLLMERMPAAVQVVGDDLFVTQASRVEAGAAQRIANAVLVKVNQVGTLTEAFATLAAARRLGYRAIVSARSGETEDVSVVHLAVGSGAGQLKVGSLTRGERTAKWNEALRIEESLGRDGVYGWRPVQAPAELVERTRA
jgi:enolase